MDETQRDVIEGMTPIDEREPTGIIDFAKDSRERWTISRQSRYNLSPPGGPDGPFWGIVRDDGCVIALRVGTDRAQAQRIIDALDAYPELAALNARIEALTEALGLYGRHLDDGNGGCGARSNPVVWPCTCGLTAALSKPEA